MRKHTTSRTWPPSHIFAPGWTDRGGVRDTRTARNLTTGTPVGVDPTRLSTMRTREGHAKHKSIASAVLFDLGQRKTRTATRAASAAPGCPLQEGLGD